MRDEDIIADFLAKLDLSRRSPDDAARDLIAALENHQRVIRDEYEEDDFGC